MQVFLGLNGTTGHGFKEFVGGARVDNLISIENVIGTDGEDEITGNEASNRLDGRDGDDVIDGGLGNDTMIGGLGKDTAAYASHNSLSTFEIGNIVLGFDGLFGTDEAPPIPSSIPSVLR